MANDEKKPKVRTVQRTGIDLATFNEVTLKKVVPPMEPITSTEQALALLGNDNNKLLEVITMGIQSIRDKQVVADASIPWRTLTDEKKLNGEFTGTLADSKKVGNFILMVAKTQFGFSKDLDKDAKSAAKDKAKDWMKRAISAGLLTTDGFLPDADSDEDEEDEETANG